MNFFPEFNLGPVTRTSTPSTCPEMAIDIEAEARAADEALMDEKDCVNVFVSEGRRRATKSWARCGRAARRSSATPSAMSSSTRSMSATGSPSGSPKLLGAGADAGAEVRLFRPLRRRQCRGPAPHQGHGRSTRWKAACAARAALIGHDEERRRVFSAPSNSPASRAARPLI